METAPPGSDESEAAPQRVLPLPEATIAGDWTILTAIAAAIVVVLMWRRPRQQRGLRS